MEKIVIHLIVGESGAALGSFILGTHTGPDIGVDDVRIRGGLRGELRKCVRGQERRPVLLRRRIELDHEQEVQPGFD